MKMEISSKKELIEKFFDIGVIKFGDFKLKSGINSPVYLDLRVIVGYPNLLKSISNFVYEEINKEVQQLCGVPYTALPIASYISVNYNIPSVIKRKEAKDYGTKRMIEGVYKNGDRCTIIEDIISSGGSVINTAEELEKAGLFPVEVIVIVDRCQGGRKNVENYGITMKSLFTFYDIFDTLKDLGKITTKQYQDLRNFIESTSLANEPIQRRLNQTFDKYMEMSKNKVGQRLLSIIKKKQSRLCVAADVTSMAQLIDLANNVGPHICVLKIHADIINDFDVGKMLEIRKMAENMDFLIMEDRKFGDIGQTTKLQLLNSKFSYLSWCDIVTVHANSGDSLYDGIRDALKVTEKSEVGCIIIAEMSSSGAVELNKNDCLQLAYRNIDLVIGFVSQSMVADGKSCSETLLHFTPGVKIDCAKGNKDNLGQQYRTVENVKQQGYVDVYIVGRGITQEKDIVKTTELYKKITF